MNYRPEIDGLRALAVIPVMAFHAGISGLSGGFAGVDVFFVISGYLITSIIHTEYLSGHFSFAHFYRRRALRLLPPLFLVLFATLVCGYFFLLPSALHELGKSTLAATFFSSNFYFWSQSGYFEGSADLQPLLHTWSLAVEEQFYLVFPLLLFAILKWCRKYLTWALVLMAIGSFVLSVIAVQKSPNAAFYWLPFRAWELGLGSILAVSGFESKAFLNTRHVRNLLGLTGVGLVIFSYLYLTPDMPFPGYNAMFPAFGALLIIIAGKDCYTGRLLAASPVVFIGLISYSLYLWHWPITVFSGMQMDDGITRIALIFALSFALSAVSMRWVEKPMRFQLKRVPSRKILVSSAVCLTFVSGVSLAFSEFNLNENRYSSEVLRISKYVDYRDTADYEKQFRRGTCFIASEDEGFESESYDRTACLKSKPDTKNFIIIGDSHAAHLWRGLDEALGPNINLMQATASGCRPVLNPKGQPRCTDVINYVYEEYIPAHAVDGVILSARWPAKTDFDKVEQTVQYLQQYVKTVVVLGPTVEYHGAFPSLLAQELIGRPGFTENLVDSDRQLFDQKMKTTLTSDRVKYISIYDIVCPDGECETLSGEGEPMQFDYGHFTLSGARDVALKIVSHIDE